MSERVLGLGLVEIFVFATLLAGAFATAEKRHQLIGIGMLAILSGGAQLAWMLSANQSILYAFLALTLVFYAAVASVLVLALFRRGTSITMDTMCSAVSVYLLLGLIWAMAYAILELAVPGSFSFPANEIGNEQQFDRFLGFSLTTLTTLGYGNVAPATLRADALSTLEAVCGQVYLAVVIARLVALQILQRDQYAKDS